MRRHLKNTVLRELATEYEAGYREPVERELTEKEMARNAMVTTYGAKCSAWLLAQHRRQLHTKGVVDFVIPERPNKVVSEKLRWFFIGMEFLRQRDGWAVDISTARGKRTFRVRWLSFHSWRRDEPS